MSPSLRPSLPLFLLWLGGAPLLGGCASDYGVVPEDPSQCEAIGGQARYIDGDADGWAATSCCALSDDQLVDGHYDPVDPNLCPSGAQSKEEWEDRGGGVSDCDDGDDAVHPNNDAETPCDSIDSDCDQAYDDGGAPEWSYDGDSDGYGDANLGNIEACEQPAGYVAESGDCDDADVDVHPAASEVCNGSDDNCDGEIDEGASGELTVWYADADQDGYGDADDTTVSCEAPEGYTDVAGDCDDAQASVSPEAPEVCDGIDDDCDGEVDEGAAPTTWYADTDGDGYGDPASSTASCDAPSGYTADDGDCDDTDPAVYPGAALPSGDDAWTYYTGSGASSGGADGPALADFPATYAGTVADGTTVYNESGGSSDLHGFRTWAYVDAPLNTTIAINGDDDVSLYIDDALVAGRNGSGAGWASGTIDVACGWHEVEAVIADSGGRAELYFDPAMGSIFDVLSSTAP